MRKSALSKLETIMLELGEWNTEMMKDAAGYHLQEMRAVSLNIADLDE